MSMEKQELLQKLLANNHSEIITTKQVSDVGLHRSVLSQLVKEKELVRVSRGVYMKPTVWEDEMYLLQYRYKKGIFSCETALYLHGMSDRTPARFTMTFPWGYNAKSLNDESINMKRSVKGLYELGIIEMYSPAGNIIKVYDLERTLCDIVRGSNACDIAIVNHTMKSYVSFKGKNLQKLMEYAEKLHVKSKILNYMEVLL